MPAQRWMCPTFLVLALLAPGVSAAASRIVALPSAILVTPSPPADWSVLGGQAGARMGRVATSAGDVNGDGYDDLLVGSEWHDNGETDEGRVCAFHGSPEGLAVQAAWCTESNVSEAHFGYSASTADDVNGDGYDDVMVGAPWCDHGQFDEGCAYLFLGSPVGLADTPAWTWESDQDGARLGIVSTAGDVNGDGFSDVVIGAPAYDGGQIDEGNQTSATLGMFVSTAGDVDGDGYADLLISAPSYDAGESNEGRVYLYKGSAAGLPTIPDWTAEGNQDSALFGYSGRGHAGDINGDGYADIAIGALWFDGSLVDEGAVFVYYGGPASGTAVTLTSFAALTKRTVVDVPKWIAPALLVMALVIGTASRRRASHSRDVQTVNGGNQ